jgi:hypothetical protein
VGVMVAEALVLVAVVHNGLRASEVDRVPGTEAGGKAYSGGGCSGTHVLPRAAADFRSTRRGRGGGCSRELKNGLSCGRLNCRRSKSWDRSSGAVGGLWRREGRGGVGALLQQGDGLGQELLQQTSQAAAGNRERAWWRVVVDFTRSCADGAG